MSQLCRSIASFPLQSGERETGAVRGAENHEQPTPPPLPLFAALPPRRLAESSKSNILNDEENETWETAIREQPSAPPFPALHPQHYSTRHPPHPSNEACIHHPAHGASKQTREVWEEWQAPSAFTLRSIEGSVNALYDCVVGFSQTTSICSCLFPAN